VKVPPAGVLLLLGAPRVGKSLLAAALQEAHSSSVVACYGVGQQLRDLGLVDEYAAHPTAARRAQLREMGTQMLAAKCKELQEAVGAGDGVSSSASSSRWGTPRSCTAQTALLHSLAAAC
jgi:hypothetical protein